MGNSVCAREHVIVNTRDAAMLLGVPIDRKSLAELTEEALQAIDRKIPRRVFACANPHSLVVAHDDPFFRSALNRAATVVADGIGVTLAARLTRLKIGPRITGSDYFLSVMNALRQRGQGRVFFFGSSQRVLDLIAARFQVDFPALTICGVFAPPFGTWTEEKNSAMVRAINQARPDVLWVGMTAPKQEKWVEANRSRLDIPVIGSIGAVFDYYAGTCPRAPLWMRLMGMEWAYRLTKAPRQMWRRNIISAPRFVALVLWHHVASTH